MDNQKATPAMQYDTIYNLDIAYTLGHDFIRATKSSYFNAYINCIQVIIKFKKYFARTKCKNEPTMTIL